MPDVGGQIPALVTLLTMLGGGVAWWLRRRDSKKDPIPKESAAVALADSSVAIMKDVAAELRRDLATEREIRAQDRAQHAADRANDQALHAAERASDRAQHAAELDALKTEMSALHSGLATTKTELAETRADIDWLRTTLGVAASYIEKLLRWAREDSRPPIPPLPEKLRTLIDPSLHTLDEET